MNIRGESPIGTGIKITLLLLIVAVVSERGNRDHANTPLYVARVCAGTWTDYRESQPDCARWKPAAKPNLVATGNATLVKSGQINDHSALATAHAKWLKRADPE